VGGYGSSHEKGVNGGGGLAQQRDRNEVTNSKVFDIIRELRPKCSSTKMEKQKNEGRKKDKEKTSCHLKLPNYISLYKLENP
jgi:topoisomerase IA-like protein